MGTTSIATASIHGHLGKHPLQPGDFDVLLWQPKVGNTCPSSQNDFVETVLR